MAGLQRVWLVRAEGVNGQMHEEGSRHAKTSRSCRAPENTIHLCAAELKEIITAKQEVSFHSRINPQTLTSAVVHGQEGWTGGSDKLSVWRQDGWRSCNWLRANLNKERANGGRQEEPSRAGDKAGWTGGQRVKSPVCPSQQNRYISCFFTERTY